MNTLHRTILSAALGFAIIQILPLQQRSNPPIHPERRIEASLDVPPQVEAILTVACKDCHSHETKWPWYARIAPVSWLIAGDVEKARRAMDLSEWSTRPLTATGALIAACTGIQDQRMPPAAYRAMHPAARLTAEQADALCGWSMTQARSLRKHAVRAAAWRKF
jgi:heme-binding protein